MKLNPERQERIDRHSFEDLKDGLENPARTGSWLHGPTGVYWVQRYFKLWLERQDAKKQE
jgi:hypothetical protein